MKYLGFLIYNLPFVGLCLYGYLNDVNVMFHCMYVYGSSLPILLGVEMMKHRDLHNH